MLGSELFLVKRWCGSYIPNLTVVSTERGWPIKPYTDASTYRSSQWASKKLSYHAKDRPIHNSFGVPKTTLLVMI